MFLTYIYITLLLPSFVLTLCICLDYFIEGHRVISYTSTVTCYPLKIKSLPLPLPLPVPENLMLGIALQFSSIPITWCHKHS